MKSHIVLNVILALIYVTIIALAYMFQLPAIAGLLLIGGAGMIGGFVMLTILKAIDRAAKRSKRSQRQ